MIIIKRFFILFIFYNLFINCQSSQQVSYDINVSSIGDSVNTKKYILIPGNKDIPIDDLQFKEYATYLNRALKLYEFVPVSSFNEADIGIIFYYGIDDPKSNQYSYNVPTWGQTGVSSSKTYGTVNSYGNYSSNTYNTPSYGITGSTTRYDTYTTYRRFMKIDAIDMREYLKSNKIVSIWNTSVTSIGSSGDLRLILPIMVVGSMPYLGKNSGKLIELSISEGDQRIDVIKGIQKTKNE